jgi:hypothetical protein
MVATQAEVPARVRLELAHAQLQWVASSLGVRLLHIKGVALDPRLSWPGRTGSDVDVLVPAADAERMVGGLEDTGWRLVNTFRNSSAFEHAATLWHEELGWADVHRYFPGINRDPGEAFDVLWGSRTSAPLGGFDCAVPSLSAQILVLVLHAARSPASGRAPMDIATSWGAADPATRAEVLALVHALRAEVGFAAAVGGLDAYQDERDHDLWQVVSSGGTRVEEWRARIKAASTRRAALTLALRAPLVNTEHLAMVLGRTPSLREVVVEFFARPLRGLRETRARRRSRAGQPPQSPS